MQDAARRYLNAGLCVLPARRDQKRPKVAWKPYQSRLPTPAELDAWFTKGHDALCVLAGEVSGRTELIDFDNGAELFDGGARRSARPHRACWSAWSCRRPSPTAVTPPTATRLQVAAT